jgi:hypothetical protein
VYLSGIWPAALLPMYLIILVAAFIIDTVELLDGRTLAALIDCAKIHHFFVLIISSSSVPQLLSV